MMDPKGYYEALGLHSSATDRMVKLAFRELSMLYHPDRPGGDTKKMVAISDAYRVLSDPERRKRYDNTGSDATTGAIYDRAAMLLQTFFTQYLDNGGDDDDVVKIIHASLVAGAETTRKQKATNEATLRKLQRRTRKLRKRSPGNDLYRMLLDLKIKDAQQRIAADNEQLAVFDQCKILANDYTEVPAVLDDDLSWEQLTYKSAT